MERNNFDRRFFESTRGQIVTILRGEAATVEELAARLKLTDNAVRAHLSTLERDGLVRQSGRRRGPRKPHFTYTLTAAADKLFPKAYDALLNQLITVLKSRLQPAEIDEVLRAVGRAYRELIHDWTEVLPTQSVCLQVPVALAKDYPEIAPKPAGAAPQATTNAPGNTE